MEAQLFIRYSPLVERFGVELIGRYDPKTDFQPRTRQSAAAVGYLCRTLLGAGQEGTEKGAAVIVLTSDVDAALETCDRIHVLYRGVLTRFMERSAYNRAEIIAAMMQASKDE